jgi:hypothetical protein
MATVSHYTWGSSIHNWNFLVSVRLFIWWTIRLFVCFQVRLDELYSCNSLGCSHCSGSFHWIWSSVRLSSVLQLPGRLLYFTVSPRCESKVFRKLTSDYSAASAVAANIILRSSVAAGFPLFTKQMFENMGIQWACTLLGCLAAVMIPIPLVFRAYGPFLRGKSKLFQ